jgi:DNA-binding GntR family transcriptional regulator
MAEHTALFEAILAGDAARAGALMLDHSRRTGAAIAAMDCG